MARNPLSPTQRPSTQETLADLYNSLSSTVSDAFGVRSHLLNKPGNQMAWGLSSQAGSPSFATTNYTVDRRSPRQFQPDQFIISQRTLATSFNNAAQQFATTTLKLPDSRYTTFAPVSAGLSGQFRSGAQTIRTTRGVRAI